MSDQRFAVIGLGQFGSAIAKNLSNRGAEVLAIDSSLEKVEGIKDEVSHAVALDATDKKALLSQNIQDVDAVVVAIGENFQALLLCTFLLIELKVKRIITRSMGNDQRRILEKMGVTEILSPAGSCCWSTCNIAASSTLIFLFDVVRRRLEIQSGPKVKT